jgi:hypothetical protein
MASHERPGYQATYALGGLPTIHGLTAARAQAILRDAAIHQTAALAQSASRRPRILGAFRDLAHVSRARLVRGLRGVPLAPRGEPEVAEPVV